MIWLLISLIMMINAIVQGVVVVMSIAMNVMVISCDDDCIISYGDDDSM